jgi:hypothetical protein
MAAIGFTGIARFSMRPIWKTARTSSRKPQHIVATLDQSIFVQPLVPFSARRALLVREPAAHAASTIGVRNVRLQSELGRRLTSFPFGSPKAPVKIP